MNWLKRNVTPILFAILLLIVGFGLGQYYLQKSYQQHLEANYRRALREFATHIDNLEIELSQARIASSERQIQEIAANLRRHIYAAQANLGQLPLGEIDLVNIKQTMAHAYDQGVLYSTRTLDDSSLQALYEQVQYINKEVQSLLQTKEAGGPWITWDRYFSASLVFSQGISAALSAINDGLTNSNDLAQIPQQFRGEITGEEITGEEAIVLARNFYGHADTEFSVINEGDGDIPSYTLEARGKSGETITIEVSRQGGLVLWMINSLTVPNSQLELNELSSYATSFLEERGFPKVYMTDAQMLQNKATLTFVPVRDGILRYTEPLKVQVSGLDGQILGFHGVLYYSAQSRNTAIQVVPEHDSEYVLDSLNHNAKVIKQQMAIISNDFNEEILTHRLGVDYDGEYFLIYINAQTGEEEKIVPVTSGDLF